MVLADQEYQTWQISDSGLFQNSKFKDFYLSQLDDGQLIGEKYENSFLSKPKQLGWTFDGFSLKSTFNSKGVHPHCGT